MTTKQKIIWTTIIIVFVALSGFIYWRYYFVYAEGTKAGLLNTFQKKEFFLKPGKGKLFKVAFVPMYKAMNSILVLPVNLLLNSYCVVRAKK